MTPSDRNYDEVDDVYYDDDDDVDGFDYDDDDKYITNYPISYMC
jgi:hypothetical protein